MPDLEHDSAPLGELTKYTPGPWYLGGTDEKTGHIEIRADDFFIADVIGGFTDGGKTQRANANLIAAAPDMLEALKEVPDPADFANADDYREAVNLWWAAFAKPAIAKAEGGAA